MKTVFSLTIHLRTPKIFRALFPFLWITTFSLFSQNSVENNSNIIKTQFSEYLNKNQENSGIIIKRAAKNTITPVLLNRGDILEFTLHNGQKRTIKLLETEASIMRTNVEDFSKEQANGGTIAQFTCKVLIDGHPFTMQRYLPTQESFYEPYVINGLRIWFDAVQDYFDFFTLKHGWAKPRANARFAVSDANDQVAPGLSMWYPNDELFIDVRDCYLGDDVWMGPYRGGSPHAGLDIDMPKGTPIFAPFDFDDQWLSVNFEPKVYYFASTVNGVKNWPNGSIWSTETLHLDKYLVQEHTPLKKGVEIAKAAGTGVGAMEHSHFQFMIRDNSSNTVDDKVMVLGNISFERDENYIIDVDGVIGLVPKSSALYIKRKDRPKDYSVFMVSEETAIKNNFQYEIPQIPLDPWILFWQMFENERLERRLLNSHIASLSPTKTGEKVFFSSRGTRPGPSSDIEHLNYYWTFGDGGFSDSANPEHVFAAPGIYPISLVVDDGVNRDRYTQHITVDGNNIDSAVLLLSAQSEPTFYVRKPYVMDVYGEDISYIPHTLSFVARQTSPRPETKEINLINAGGGELGEVSLDIMYDKNKDWAKVVHKNKGNNLIVSVDASRLSPGIYTATVKVKAPKALNLSQTFRISLEIPSKPANNIVVIDDSDPGFFATPYFWVGSRFHEWIAGYNEFYLTNGGRAKEGEYVRFTPDLQEGRYEVYFVPETPFREAKFKVLVHDKDGDHFVWVEPSSSRKIGEFTFSEGMDGFVQVLAAGSEGEILADAVRFEKIK